MTEKTWLEVFGDFVDAFGDLNKRLEKRIKFMEETIEVLEIYKRMVEFAK